jgi:hypothetical protein
MIFSPGVEKQLPIRFYEIHRSANVSIGHPALGDDSQVDDVDACFPFADNVSMRRLVIGGVDDETHSILAKDGDHSKQ